MPRAKKKSTEVAASITYPALHWTAENFGLTWAMITVLSEFDAIRRTIWPREGDAATGKTKAEAHGDLAIRLLENIPQYTDYVHTPEGVKHYGRMIKGKVTKLQEQYDAAKERLGVTGAGLPTEEAIWAKSELRNVWDAVKRTCPYFYELRDLIGNRTSVCDHAITNSEMGTVTNFMDRGKSAIEVEDEADMPQEIDSDDEFPVDPRLIIETKKGENVCISIFLKYLSSILIRV